MTPKVLVVFGTRPEAIKLAPVIREMARRGRGLAPVVCVSGQHRELLAQVLALFKIRPAYDLAIMRDRQRLSDVTIGILRGLERVVGQERPDWLMVQGDTTTALAAALAAHHHRIPVAHVEAGLRTGDLRQPFPEELNRRLIDAGAAALFAPTNVAADNLRREGVPISRIRVTGNTGIDALLAVTRRAGRRRARRPGPRLLVATLHRRESFGAPLKQMCLALRDIVHQYPDVRLVVSVHPNPQVRIVMRAVLGGQPRIALRPPLDYRRFVELLEHSDLILTDSGGLQEEAPSLGKPVLVLRNVTDRPEAVSAGTARLAGTARAGIVRAAMALLDDPRAYAAMIGRRNPYGDGQASRRIVDALARWPRG